MVQIDNLTNNKVLYDISVLITFSVFIIHLVIVFVILTEFMGIILFDEFNSKRKNISKWIVCIPLLNIIGYAKYANVNVSVAIIQIIAEFFMIVFSVYNINITAIAFIVFLITNSYLTCKFGNKYNLPSGDIFLSCIISRFLLLENFMGDDIND